jgi:hypothetical protein
VVAAFSVDWPVAEIVNCGALPLRLKLFGVDDALDKVQSIQVFLGQDIVLFIVVLG